MGDQQASFQSGVANPPRPAGASLFDMPSISNTPGTPGYGAPATQSLTTQMAQPIGLPNGQQLNMGPQQAQPAQSLFGQQPTAQTGPQAEPPPMTPGFMPGDTFNNSGQITGPVDMNPIMQAPITQPIMRSQPQPVGAAPGVPAARSIGSVQTPIGPAVLPARPVSQPVRPAPRAPMPTRSTKGYVSRLGR